MKHLNFYHIERLNREKYMMSQYNSDQYHSYNDSCLGNCLKHKFGDINENLEYIIKNKIDQNFPKYPFIKV